MESPPTIEIALTKRDFPLGASKSEILRGKVLSRSGDRGLDLGADSNLPLWDGTRPDYDWAVGALLRTG